MSAAASPTLSPSADPARVSFDQLDALVRVTTVRAWVYLAMLFVVCAAAVSFAVIYQVPIKVNGEGILLIERDTLSHVRALATGRLVTLRVKLGDFVAPGDEIGEISQDELKDSIREAQSKRDDLEREDRELTQFEQQERETQEAALVRLRKSILQAQDTSKDKLKIARRVVAGADRLRSDKHLGDIELLESREKLYLILDDLNKGQSRLAELELESIKAENTRRRARIDRGLKIKQLETKLALDRDKLTRTSRVVSHVRGQVAQVLSAADELVREGAPIVLMHAPKTDRGADDAGRPYDTIVFVPAGEGKKIEVGNTVEVSPTTVKREEHGFIRGSVVAVSELPVTRLAMEAALAHPELVDTFLKRYAPGVLLRVHVKLQENGAAHYSRSIRPNAERRNPFVWSSSSGPAQPLKTGTMCQAAIVVDKRKLISLILPWTKKVVGAD
jgi:HlyD family secretion protein